MAKKGCCSGDVEGDPNDVLLNLPPAMAGGKTVRDLQLQIPQTLDGMPMVCSQTGDIMYPPRETPPPDIDGYARNKDNPFVFHPLWPDCPKRYQGVKYHGKTHSIEPIMVCMHADHPKKTQFVSCEDCTGCPLRPKTDG